LFFEGLWLYTYTGNGYKDGGGEDSLYCRRRGLREISRSKLNATRERESLQQLQQHYTKSTCSRAPKNKRTQKSKYTTSTTTVVQKWVLALPTTPQTNPSQPIRRESVILGPTSGWFRHRVEGLCGRGILVSCCWVEEVGGKSGRWGTGTG
jgi:hypothetical protein